MLIFEFIGRDTSAPTLRDVISGNEPLRHYSSICLNLCRALHHLHNSDFLHNDLHPGNILISDSRFVKLIYFGKATLVEDPVIYSIKPGSPKHERYNSLHRHLGFELRNVPGSCTTVESDIYSLGYCLNKLAILVECASLKKISMQMMYEIPKDRITLSFALKQLSKI